MAVPESKVEVQCRAELVLNSKAVDKAEMQAWLAALPDDAKIVGDYRSKYMIVATWTEFR